MNNSDLLKCYELLEKITMDKVMLREKHSDNPMLADKINCSKEIRKLEELERGVLNVLKTITNDKD